MCTGARRASIPGAALLEGRDRESLRLSRGCSVAAASISFLDDQGYQALTLSAWTRAASIDFLDWVLEYRVAASDGKLTSRLPLFEQLCEHILETSAGNPVHIIEQLKALIERTTPGCPSEARLPERHDPRHLETPSGASKLIESRLDFLRSTIPDAADLLVVLGKTTSVARAPVPLHLLGRADAERWLRFTGSTCRKFRAMPRRVRVRARELLSSLSGCPISGHLEDLHRAIDYFERKRS